VGKESGEEKDEDEDDSKRRESTVQEKKRFSLSYGGTLSPNPHMKIGGRAFAIR